MKILEYDKDCAKSTMLFCRKNIDIEGISMQRMEWFPPSGERRPQHQMLPTCSSQALSLIASRGQKTHLGMGCLHTWTSVWKLFDSLTHQTWRFFEITVKSQTLPSFCGNHSKYSCVCYHFCPLLLNSLSQTSM